MIYVRITAQESAESLLRIYPFCDSGKKEPHTRYVQNIRTENTFEVLYYFM